MARKAEVSDAGDDFATAARAWAEVRTAFLELLDKRDALKAAIELSDNPGDRSAERAAPAREIAGEYLELAMRSPRQVAEAFEEVEYQIQDAQPGYLEAFEEWQRQCRRETNRLARELQPGQVEAVRDMARALEQLSAAMTAEAEIRAELVSQAPNPTSAFLPDCSHELALIGTLAEWSSPASAWARRMRKLKIIE